MKSKTGWQLLVASISACALWGCSPQPPDVQFVRQRIPIRIQDGKPVTIEIQSLSGNGCNNVGIQCSPEVWNVLAKGQEKITVKLKSSNKKGTEIGGVSPGGGRRWPIESFHYLFYICGEHDAKATVEIIFPNAPPGTTHADIIVDKTPIDTKPFGGL